MLRNIDPILSPDLLHVLGTMGHGDEIVITDANFPAQSTGPLCIRADVFHRANISGPNEFRNIQTPALQTLLMK